VSGRAEQKKRDWELTKSSARAYEGVAKNQGKVIPDAEAKFIHDFVVAWVKIMKLDRFDLKTRIGNHFCKEK